MLLAISDDLNLPERNASWDPRLKRQSTQSFKYDKKEGVLACVHPHRSQSKLMLEHWLKGYTKSDIFL